MELIYITKPNFVTLMTTIQIKGFLWININLSIWNNMINKELIQLLIIIFHIIYIFNILHKFISIYFNSIFNIESLIYY